MIDVVFDSSKQVLMADGTRPKLRHRLSAKICFLGYFPVDVNEAVHLRCVFNYRFPTPQGRAGYKRDMNVKK